MSNVLVHVLCACTVGRGITTNAISFPIRAHHTDLHYQVPTGYLVSTQWHTPLQYVHTKNCACTLQTMHTTTKPFSYHLNIHKRILSQPLNQITIEGPSIGMYKALYFSQLYRTSKQWRERKSEHTAAQPYLNPRKLNEHHFSSLPTIWKLCETRHTVQVNLMTYSRSEVQQIKL